MKLPTVPDQDLLARIDINPQVMLGKPVIRGTRITVEILLEKIAAGSPSPLAEIYDRALVTRAAEGRLGR